MHKFAQFHMLKKMRMFFWTVTQKSTTKKSTFRKLQNVATKCPDNSIINITNFRRFCTESLQTLSCKVPFIVTLIGLLEANYAIFAFAKIVVESPNYSPIIRTFRWEPCNFCRIVAETSANCIRDPPVRNIDLMQYFLVGITVCHVDAWNQRKCHALLFISQL